MSARVVSLACTAVLISLGMVAVGWRPLAEVVAQVSYILVLLALLIAFVSGILRGRGGRGKDSAGSSPPEYNPSQADSSIE